MEILTSEKCKKGIFYNNCIHAQELTRIKIQKYIVTMFPYD